MSIRNNISSDINGLVASMHPECFWFKTGNYTVLTSDYVVGLGTLTSSITITLPASPTIGDQYIIKDVNGTASSFSTTISGNGNNIDGSSNFIISQNYASLSWTKA